MNVIEILIGYLLVMSIIDVICIAAFNIERIDFVDPIRNYEEWGSMNWFGVGLFTIVLNIACPVISIFYWFMKLCTIGRRT